MLEEICVKMVQQLQCCKHIWEVVIYFHHQRNAEQSRRWHKLVRNNNTLVSPILNSRRTLSSILLKYYDYVDQLVIWWKVSNVLHSVPGHQSVIEWLTELGIPAAHYHSIPYIFMMKQALHVWCPQRPWMTCFHFCELRSGRWDQWRKAVSSLGSICSYQRELRLFTKGSSTLSGMSQGFMWVNKDVRLSSKMFSEHLKTFPLTFQ